MIGSRPVQRHLLAACLLAASLLLAGSSVLTAADSNQLAWAPSREDAIVVDGVPASMLPRDSALSRSLMSQRPRNLSQPPPGRPRTHLTDGPTGKEALPGITGTPLSPEGLPVPRGMYYDEAQGGMMPDGHPCEERCGPCGPGNWGGWGACVWIPLCVFVPRPPLDGLEFAGGVQGFTGPVNRGQSGSFGFHEGFNWGMPLCGYLAGQWGANWTQDNFDGNYLTPDLRHQIFVTGGLYRRVDWGFQGGLVVDYLHDEWDYSADLVQLRGELSYLWCERNDIGCWFTVGVNDSENLAVRQPVDTGSGLRFVNTTGTIAVNDIFAFFFRRQFDCGGQGRLYGGFTGNSQGIFGGDAQFPLNPSWSLRSSFIYASPGSEDSAADPRFARESWNLGISLVWTPCPRSSCGQNYCRPLFNVADNGTFLTRLGQ
jgi:hypothetical protein